MAAEETKVEETGTTDRLDETEYQEAFEDSIEESHLRGGATTAAGGGDDDNDDTKNDGPDAVLDADCENANAASLATEDASTSNAGEGDNKREHLPADAPFLSRMGEVVTTYWPLGLLAFGGPATHVAILKDRLVDKSNWLDEASFLELFAIGQGLPGPTSTQLVISSALSRAGPVGGLIAFVLWQLPGMIALTVCGALIATFVDANNPPWWLVGLPPATIALLFKAFYQFALKLDTLGIILALFSSLAAILINNDARIPSTSSQYVFPAVLVIGASITLIDSKRSKPFSSYGSPSAGWDRDSDETMKRIGIPLWVGASLFVVWALVLVFSILLVEVWKVQNVYLDMFQTMFLVGSLIFGGGEVVLPMLQDIVVPAWMTRSQFFQGLGLAQSIPGPLFNVSAYMGAVYQGVPGALVAFVGLFGPGVILIYAIVPFWARLRHLRWFRAVLSGLNATAIGLVGAACVTLWESAIVNAANSMVFAVALTICVVFDVGAPWVILTGGICGAILSTSALNLGQQPYCIDQGFAYPPNGG